MSILTPMTAEENIDLRVSVPHLVPFLLPGERVINIIQDIHDPREHQPMPSAIDILHRLAGATILGTSVEFPRPVFASIAADSDAANEHLRKYEALYGRDSLRVAQDVLPIYPQLARVTIIELAKHQGRTRNKFREEEKGKIIHELRDPHDPIATLLTDSRGWQWPYYGSIDATPTFISTVVRYIKNSQEHLAFLEQPIEHRDGDMITIMEAFAMAVDWLVSKLEETDGLLEFRPSFETSIENQVWKDSPDSYFHSDGSMANPEKGVSSIETQCIAYDALLDAVELYEMLEDSARARKLHELATKLKHVTLTKFWSNTKGGFFALGLDRDHDDNLRQLDIKTSNMGHVLNSQMLLTDERDHIFAESTIRQLFSEQLLAPAGIRTLASDEIRYRPHAYHNGSVWPWDTYFIAQGLQKHGYYGLASNLIERIEATMEINRGFPEYVSGGADEPPISNKLVIDIWDPVINKVNRIEQPPQENQAWSVAAVIAIQHGRPFMPPHALDEYKRRLELEILHSIPPVPSP